MRSSAFAVLRLTTNSSFVGRTTGRSAGLAIALDGVFDQVEGLTEYEPKHRTGFCTVDPLTGLDRRNRLGRRRRPG